MTQRVHLYRPDAPRPSDRVLCGHLEPVGLTHAAEDGRMVTCEACLEILRATLDDTDPNPWS